jgi:hypothetical protein
MTVPEFRYFRIRTSAERFHTVVVGRTFRTDRNETLTFTETDKMFIPSETVLMSVATALVSVDGMAWTTCRSMKSAAVGYGLNSGLLVDFTEDPNDYAHWVDLIETHIDGKNATK